MQIYQPPGEAVPVTPQRDDVVPRKVGVAMAFIELCNRSMGVIPMGQDDKGEVCAHERELHFAQEAAFKIACTVVGNYLAEGEGERQGATETVQGLSREAETGGKRERVVRDREGCDGGD